MEWLTMQRQRLHWLLGTLAVVVGVFLAAMFFEWMENETAEAKFNKIEPGMTIVQVETLIGPPSLPSSSGRDGTTARMWCFPEQCVFQVWFDANGKVIYKEVCEGSLQTKRSFQDFIKRFLRNLGL
jgi:hypothetical protein